MRSQWITSWILWLGQHLKLYGFLIAIVLLATLLGLVWLPDSFAFLFAGEAKLVLLSMLLMAVVAIKLLDSVKTAILLLVVMLLLYFVSSALYLWLNIAHNEYSVLSRVVVVTIMMSHLIHFIASLLREMARGIHQYDAIIEALVITHQPILVSSLTTIFGFVVVSIFNHQFSVMAYQVIIGVSLSYLSLLVLVPVILMNWLLEFRVGHYADRHGLDWVLKLATKYPPWWFLAKYCLLHCFYFYFLNLYWLSTQSLPY